MTQTRQTSRRGFLGTCLGIAGASFIPKGLESALAGESKNISPKGLDLIKSSEGYSSSVYLCPAGKRTIGYGHLLRKEESYKSVTPEQAEKLLKQDTNYAKKVVDKYVQTPLTQPQYDALCSFVYNLGGENFRKSTLLKKLNKRDYEGASKEFSRWVYAKGKKLKGLVIRRAKEKALFQSK